MNSNIKAKVRIQRRQPGKLPKDFPDTLSPMLGQIYAARGIKSNDELGYALKDIHSYSELTGIKSAVELLTTALTEQHKIIIVGDFDADGATSSALAVRVLRQLGADVDYLVPNRFQFGYGLTPEIVAVAAESVPQLLITVDNGISSVEGVAAAQRLGIKVLVTDHHLPGDRLPSADAIVNPNQLGDIFPSKSLAGVGTIFYVFVALRAHLRQLNWFAEHNIDEPNMASFLDLLALGTIADVVPLDKNNRALVAQGMARIKSGQCCAGIKALLKISNRELATLSAADLAFAVGPRLNAAGRLEDMSIGVECLLTDDDELAREYAMQLDELNQERKSIENDMKQQALSELASLQLDEADLPLGLCFYDKRWHEGVIGILASRIKDKTYRPVIAFAESSATTDDQQDGIKYIKGSARSISSVHIRDVLDTVAARYPNLLNKFGGHAMAAGMTIKEDDFAAFSDAFNQVVSEQISAESCESIILSDGALSKQHLSMSLAEEIKQGGPWGQGFPEPIFDDEFALITRRIVGQRHLKLIVGKDQQHFDAIAFNVTDEHWPKQVDRVKVAYKLDINHFRGNSQLQLMVEYIEPVVSDEEAEVVHRTTASAVTEV